MSSEETIISHTKAWIKNVVIGCNFCPFAAKAVLQKSIRYMVSHEQLFEDVLKTLVSELVYLNQHVEIETTLIILPEHFSAFEDYLDLVGAAESLSSAAGYDGLYQIASFHPAYLFANTGADDPANYTNRSPYPMLHILREESITQAVQNYPDTNDIPKRNVEYARLKGMAYMKILSEASFNP